MRILNSSSSYSLDKQMLNTFKRLFESCSDEQIEILSYDKRTKTLFVEVCNTTYALTRKELQFLKAKIRRKKADSFYFFEVTYTQFSMGSKVIRIDDGGELHKKFHG